MIATKPVKKMWDTNQERNAQMKLPTALLTSSSQQAISTQNTGMYLPLKIDPVEKTWDMNQEESTRIPTTFSLTSTIFESIDSKTSVQLECTNQIERLLLRKIVTVAIIPFASLIS
jgi:hypothetical protein